MKEGATKGWRMPPSAIERTNPMRIRSKNDRGRYEGLPCLQMPLIEQTLEWYFRTMTIDAAERWVMIPDAIDEMNPKSISSICDRKRDEWNAILNEWNAIDRFDQFHFCLQMTEYGMCQTFECHWPNNPKSTPLINDREHDGGLRHASECNWSKES